MDEQEIISRIRINKIPKRKAIILISDFLSLNRKEAKEVYEWYFEESAELDKVE